MTYRPFIRTNQAATKVQKALNGVFDLMTVGAQLQMQGYNVSSFQEQLLIAMVLKECAIAHTWGRFLSIVLALACWPGKCLCL